MLIPIAAAAPLYKEQTFEALTGVRDGGIEIEIDCLVR
jgi:hypothetical protein